MLNAAKQVLRNWREQASLPAEAKAEAARDARGLPAQDPGIDAAVKAALQWLKRAQDQSASKDGGVARDFSLKTGWAVSYPETTGYIVSTMIDCGQRFQDADSLERARRMLDWLVSMPAVQQCRKKKRSQRRKRLVARLLQPYQRVQA